jgi:hypothetical protein
MPLPEKFAIGTMKAFKYNYEFLYSKRTVGKETHYVCTKGSDNARPDEVLVLCCETNDGKTTWTAWDSEVLPDSTCTCRQPIFRCVDDITKPGWHNWQTNHAASKDVADGVDADWQGELWAETRLM